METSFMIRLMLIIRCIHTVSYEMSPTCWLVTTTSIQGPLTQCQVTFDSPLLRPWLPCLYKLSTNAGSIDLIRAPLNRPFVKVMCEFLIIYVSVYIYLPWPVDYFNSIAAEVFLGPPSPASSYTIIYQEYNHSTQTSFGNLFLLTEYRVHHCLAYSDPNGPYYLHHPSRDSCSYILQPTT